jgi:hypothetical protein
MINVDSTSRFLLQMREQVSAAVRLARTSQGNQGKTPRPSTSAPRDTQRLILQRVLAIDPHDPQRRRKAFRVFLESILADELGSELLNDPAYHQVVESVCRTMEGNDALAPAIDKAGDYLLQCANRESLAGAPGGPVTDPD